MATVGFLAGMDAASTEAGADTVAQDYAAEEKSYSYVSLEDRDCEAGQLSLLVHLQHFTFLAEKMVSGKNGAIDVVL